MRVCVYACLVLSPYFSEHDIQEAYYTDGHYAHRETNCCKSENDGKVIFLMIGAEVLEALFVAQTQY